MESTLRYVTINLEPEAVNYSKAADEMVEVARNFELDRASLTDLTAAATKLLNAKKAFLKNYR